MNRDRICVCVNGTREKTNGVRVRELFRDVERQADVRYLYRDDSRRSASMIRFCRELAAFRPGVVFVEGIGYAGIIAGIFARLVLGSRMILSTGDAAFAFARACMSFQKACVVGLLEWAALRASDAIVVWGPYHKALLESRGFQNVFWIPGGVDTTRFRPKDVEPLRRRLGVAGHLTVGVVGSINFNARQQFCYGWEIVEIVRRLKDLPVSGIIVGPGDGLPHLEQLARDHGIADRIVLTGWVDHDTLPDYINAMDVCVSTQSNDVVGQVRITAKVPEYLACGRFVIATAVGGAQPFVAPCGVLLENDGVRDPSYFDRAAATIRDLVANPARLADGMNGPALAKRYFDYAELRPRVRQVIDLVLSSSPTLRTAAAREL